MMENANKPGVAEVRAQLQRIYSTGQFRGVKVRRLLEFLVDKNLGAPDRAPPLSYIAETLALEPPVFEEDSKRWGYPKTRANLGHVRKTLRKYYETAGYSDQIVIKLNRGSYVPVIAYNRIVSEIPRVDKDTERTILRMKIAIDGGLGSVLIRRCNFILSFHTILPILARRQFFCLSPMASLLFFRMRQKQFSPLSIRR